MDGGLIKAYYDKYEGKSNLDFEKIRWNKDIFFLKKIPFTFIKILVRLDMGL